jgi:hypothetical protein
MQAGNQKRAERMGKMFDRADTDGDGALSKAEFDAHQKKRQDKRDRKDDKGKPKAE